MGKIIAVLLLTACVYVSIVCLIAICYILFVSFPRIDDVHIFRQNLLFENIKEYELLPDFDTMVDYSWIPLKKEYWVGKSYEKLKKVDIVYLHIRYRFFQKWRP